MRSPTKRIGCFAALPAGHPRGPLNALKPIGPAGVNDDEPPEHPARIASDAIAIIERLEIMAVASLPQPCVHSTRKTRGGSYCGGGRSSRGVSVTVRLVPLRATVTVKGLLPSLYGKKSPKPNPDDT